ncbi:uncharacterized protein LOC141752269 [Sebastes fasciatus]|uniref:uncharacterized protein LOC141752269 n=1 Tax=Sebastes fasciatus TaxID=394691 RepID=UPI003D9F239A
MSSIFVYTFEPVSAYIPIDYWGQEDTQCQILAAIRGLADRVSRMEAQRAAPLTAACSEGISPRDLPAYEEHQTDHPDAISLYAQGSLLDEGHPEIAKESHCLSLSHTGESASVDDGTGDSVPSDVFSKVLSVAKIMGLSIPIEAPSSSEGVWAGISQSRPSVTIPAAEDYCQMLRRSWNNPGSAPQFNSGCRRLVKAQYPHESGLGDMPPVEREMAALTPLGPDRVTTNPHCPRKECKKTDHLVCRSYNAAARAARAGNALALLLAALRRSASAGDQDTRNLIDAALSTHSQLTRDIGSAMSSAMMARRQIWLAQTTLPENIRKELTNMPVVPGRVFHSDSQSVLEKAEQSLRTRESVQCTFSRPAATRQRPTGQQHQFQAAWGHPEPWMRGRRQGSGAQGSGDAAGRLRRQHQGFQPRPTARGAPQRRRPPKGPGTQGASA